MIELRRRVGMVFQQPTPFPKSIYENVAYGLRIAGVRDRATLDETVESSLQRAALWDEVKDRLHESALGLSGGQHQRLCIARAIAVSPEIILMDEPCSALDPRSTTRIEDLIGELRGRVHDHHRDAQHAAGGPRVRLHGLPVRRRADRVRRDHAGCSPRRRRRKRKTTSPAASANAPPRIAAARLPPLLATVPATILTEKPATFSLRIARCSLTHRLQQCRPLRRAQIPDDCPVRSG